MRQVLDTLSLRPGRQGLNDVTGEIAAWVAGQPLRDGLLTIFIRHTSASLLIQENADPDVQRDLEAFMRKLAPEDRSLYRHVAEGPDDMPAHIRSALTQTHLAVPVASRRMMLGAWQGIYLFEHRRTPAARQIVLHLVGE